MKKTNWLIRHTLTVFSCVLIIVFGIAFLTNADPITTTIGDNIVTNDLSVAGNVTSGNWQGTAIGSQYGGTNANLSAATQGSVPYFSSVGTMSALNYGTDGYFLKTQGENNNPVWAEVASVAGPTLIVAASDSLDANRADYQCDGTADEVEIESAITALPSGGGEVHLLEGTYNISTSVDITKSNVMLTGVGNATKLYLVDGANATVIVVGDGSNSYEGITISDLQVDGNNAGNTTGDLYGIHFNQSITKSFIKKTYIHHVQGADWGTSNAAAIRFDSSSNNWIVENRIESNDRAGIRINSSVYVHIIDNEIVNNTDNWGILFSFGGYHVIEGNNISSCYGALVFSDCDKNKMVNNTISSISRTGLWLYSSNYNTIQSNIFNNIGTNTNNAYDVIRINSDEGNRNIINANIIYSNDSNKPRYGIYEESSSIDYNTITNNNISGYATVAILAQGLHTTVAGNKTSSATEGLFDISSNTGATQSALTVTQNGSGNIAEFKDGSNAMFTLKENGQVVLSPSNVQTLAAGDAISVNATHLKVVSFGGAITLTSTPTIANGTEGQILIIRGTNDTNTITVQDQGTLPSSNLEIGAATRVLGNGDILMLMFDGTDWREISFTNN